LKDKMVFYAFGLKGQLGCYTDWALILVLLWLMGYPRGLVARWL
jgi:hypothetical protein